MKELFGKGKSALGAVAEKVAEECKSGLSVISEVINGLPIFMSSERSGKFETQFDEKHYFVIPYALADAQFTLHTMRCLPEGALEINDLPKRRVFHFPNGYYEAALREQMIEAAKGEAVDAREGKVHSIEKLADQIDDLDTKLTYGMLVIGGVAAVLNPLVGVGIAAKAMLPGVAGLVSKFGVRPAGEQLSQAQLKKEMQAAEDAVRKKFSEASTVKVINPVLQELELCLRTTEYEHDPLFAPRFADHKVAELDGKRWRDLTETAICNVYEDVVESRRKHQAANLGPEDVRWLKVMLEKRKGGSGDG